jgi:hypothetical protein
MNINRNNYEEIFMLYVDGELSSSQRQSVDLFVAENPDLFSELQMLMQTKLEDEPVVFVNKNLLFKSAAWELNLQNYEEYFLCYVDDELTEDQKNKVETFVLQHPELQTAFTLLKQTKLTPENIVFTDKASLYRKERKPFIYLSFTRIAVAAAVIGFIFLVWTIKPFNTTTANELAVNKLPAAPKNDISDKQSQPDDIPAAKDVSIRQKNKEPMIDASSNNLLTTEMAVAKNDAMPVTATKALRQENIIVQENQVAAPEVGNTQTLNSTTSLVDADNKNVYQQTVYKELDTQEDDRNNKVYIGNMEVNKDKLLGLLKRAKTVLSKSKDDDSKVSIAGFGISSKSK